MDKLHQFFTILIASVWLINGFYCKVLNLVPRHQEIVSRILGDEYAQPLTILIGFSEVIMAIWYLSRYKSKISASLQIFIVGLMNILEFILVPDLLVWGRFNAIFALLFIAIVYYNEFILPKKLIDRKA